MATSIEVMRQAFDAFRVGDIKGITSLCSDGRASEPLCTVGILLVEIVTVSHLTADSEWTPMGALLPWGGVHTASMPGITTNAVFMKTQIGYQDM